MSKATSIKAALAAWETAHDGQKAAEAEKVTLGGLQLQSFAYTKYKKSQWSNCFVGRALWHLSCDREAGCHTEHLEKNAGENNSSAA